MYFTEMIWEKNPKANSLPFVNTTYIINHSQHHRTNRVPSTYRSTKVPILFYMYFSLEQEKVPKRCTSA